MGTRGYMAPEMMVIGSSEENKGYSWAVDYWSLGILMYKLLTSKIPFHNNIVASFMKYISTEESFPGDDATATDSITTEDYIIMAPSNSRHRERRRADVTMYAPKVTKHPALLAAFAKLDAIQCISTACKMTIAQFLEVDETRRLGSGPRGLREIKSQKLFRGLDWSKLTQKLITPPYIPQQYKAPELPPYESFEAMIDYCGKSRWLEETIPEEEQKYFENWYVSFAFYLPQCLFANILWF